MSASGEPKARPRTRWGGVRKILDDRTGLPGALDRAMNEPVPGGASLWYALGAVAAFLVVVEIITGILLAFYYAPSATTAWPSVAFIQDQLTMGWFVRGLHSFGSTALIVVSGLHLLQVVIWGAYKKPREANWIVGLFMLLLLIGFAITGYGLPWDEGGYWAKKVESSILGTTPIVGPLLETVSQGGSQYGNFTVTHIYAAHVFLLPAVLLGFLGLHIHLVRRHRVTPHWKLDAAQVAARTEPYFPGQAIRDLGLSAFALAFVALLVWQNHGAPLEAPADPARAYNARPEWYAIPLYQLRMYFEGPLEMVATMVIPGIAGGIVLALPFLDRKPARAPVERMPVMAALVLTLLAMGGLSYLSVAKDANSKDYQAFRRDVERRAAEARRWALLGVGPDGDPFKNDPQYQARVLFDEKCGNCHALTGEGGTEGPDLHDYNSRAWIQDFLRDPMGARFMAGAKHEKPMKPVEGSDEEIALLTELMYAETGADDVDQALLAKAIESDLYSDKDCDSCHFIEEDDHALGSKGPNLFRRGTLQYVERLIADPKHETMYGDQSTMPQFAGKLSPAQIEMLARFVIAQKQP